ncbi:MAG: hypothetical protein IKL24_04865, partial [Clostridia bacterium]|nr:hypothetical protein [Clostridia bacterium]
SFIRRMFRYAQDFSSRAREENKMTTPITEFHFAKIFCKVKSSFAPKVFCGAFFQKSDRISYSSNSDLANC